MALIHDRMGTVFQGLLVAGLAIPTLFVSSALLHAQEGKSAKQEAESSEEIESITPSEDPVPDGPLKFGDPESPLLRESQEAPSESDVREEDPEDITTEPTQESAEEEIEKLEEAVSTQIEEATSEPNPESEERKAEGQERTVQEIIYSIPPSADYTRELEEIVAKGEDAVPELIRIFQDATKSWEYRWIAASALGRIGGDGALEVLLSSLDDKLFLIRMASMEALAQANAVASAPLIRQRLSDDSMVVRSKAAESLGKLRDAGAVNLLIDELYEGRNFRRGRSLWVRKHILWALAMIGGEKAEKTMIGVLKEDEEEMRNMACQTLAFLNPQADLKMDEAEPMSCAKPWLQYFKAKNDGGTKDSEEPTESSESSQDG